MAPVLSCAVAFHLDVSAMEDTKLYHSRDKAVEKAKTIHPTTRHC